MLIEGVSALISFLLLTVIIALSFLPDDGGIGKLMILLAPLPLLPATFAIQNQSENPARVKRIRSAFLWGVFLLLDSVLVLLIMRQTRSAQSSNLFVLFFLLLLEFIGFWFLLTAILSLLNHNTPGWVTFMNFLAGTTWLILITSSLAEAVNLSLAGNWQLFLQIILILWVTSQTIWSLWLGVMLIRKVPLSPQ